MLKKLKTVLQKKMGNNVNENAQTLEDSHSLVPEDGIMPAPQPAPEAQPAPLPEQKTSNLRVAVAVGVGFVAGAAIFCTGGAAAAFLLPAAGTFTLPATLGMYTAASAVTVAASAGTGVVVAKKAENAMEKHARKAGAHEESEHLLGAAAADASPQPEQLGDPEPAAAEQSLQLVEVREVAQSAEPESQLREMAAEDINEVIVKVAMRFIRDGQELTLQSAPGNNSLQVLRKWERDNGEMGKELLKKYVKAYTIHLEEGEAQQKTAELVLGLIGVESDEYTKIDPSKKYSIIKIFRKNDCYGVKAMANVLYPDSPEAQAILIGNVESIEKHFYSQSCPSSSAFSTLADVGSDEALNSKQPSSEEASASANLPAVEYEMQPLLGSAGNHPPQGDDAP